MKFRTLIIEDESLAQQRLNRLLDSHRDVIDVIGEADNGQQGIELIHKLKPDLIFLDIQMPGLTGFEMLERLEEIPLVIFTTAYDEYALQAFETNTIDYLLKPISSGRLEKAIQKLASITGNRKQEEERLLAFVNMVQKSDNAYIKVKTGSITKLIYYKDIIFFRAEDKYTCLKVLDKAYYINDSLSTLERTLPQNFKRIHRSAIINIDYLKEILNLSIGKSIAVMQDSSELPISRRLKKNL